MDETEQNMRDYREILEFTEEENIKFIRLTFFDVFGKQKNIAIMPGELERAFNGGISFDASAIAGFGNEMRSDLFLKPDASTLSIVPWRPADGGVIRMFCDIVRPDGTPFTTDTRYLLKQAVKEAAKEGVRIDFGPEVEFYVFRQDINGEPTRIPLDQAGYMDVDPEDKGDNIRREICFTLLEMGITPEASHHGHGPGQNEIDFHYSDALTAADNTSTFKWAVRSVAQSSGAWADFSPKPLGGQPGNGMHINMSVTCRDGKDRTENFMAGILRYIKDITLFLNPVVQSYERFGRMKAPAYISWSEQNRSQLIRIPAAGTKRIELRSPDPMANPYLAYTLLIHAGLEGIRLEMQPGDPIDLNLYQADPEITQKLAQLPSGIEEAIIYARKSELVKRVIPADVLEAYCDISSRK